VIDCVREAQGGKCAVCGEEIGDHFTFSHGIMRHEMCEAPHVR
jgi:hypothetical protein